MNRQTLLDQLQHRLEDLHEKTREMMRLEKTIAQDEMDQFLREIRVIYELALSLHQHNALQAMTDLEQMVAEKAIVQPEPAQSAPTIAAHPEPTSVITQLVDNKTVTIEKSMPTEEVPAAAATARKTAGDLHEQFEERPTLAQKFREPATVATKIATRTSSSRIAESLQRKPIRDLKSGIGINEKFSFIQQLFSGNAVEYHAAIDQLNSCQNLESALSYVNTSIRSKYDWDNHTEPAGQFMEILERRFSA